MSIITRTDLDIVSSQLRMDGTWIDPSVTTTLCRSTGLNTQTFRTFPERIDHFRGIHLHLVSGGFTLASSAIVLNYPPTNKFHISLVTL